MRSARPAGSHTAVPPRRDRHDMLHCQEEAAVDGGISAKRAAENQLRYRSINEDVKTINTVFKEDTQASSEWICECADTHLCHPRARHPAQYEAVRINPRAFII
jgi:hypothetical protein